MRIKYVTIISLCIFGLLLNNYEYLSTINFPQVKSFINAILITVLYFSTLDWLISRDCSVCGDKICTWDFLSNKAFHGLGVDYHNRCFNLMRSNTKNKKEGYTEE